MDVMRGMGRFRAVMVGGVACALTSAGMAQGVVTPKDWYPADKSAVVPEFTRGVPGKPFMATAIWSTSGRDPKFGDFFTRTAKRLVARDGQGRERMSWPVAQGDARVSLSRELSVVVLLDPVARCVSLWIEDEQGKSVDAVKVRCEPEGVDVPARPAWDALTESEEDDLAKEPESKPHYEDVAVETGDVGGVKATRYRHEQIRTFDGGKREQRTGLGERWYSEALGMVVKTSDGSSGERFGRDSTSFTLADVKLGEPPAEAFMPPAGAKKEVDPKLRLVWRTSSNAALWCAEGEAPSGAWPDMRIKEMTDQTARFTHPVFPEAWYANGPTEPMPTFYQGPQRMPFDAIGQLMQYGPDAKTYYDATQTIFVNWSRDGDGRARLTFRFLNGGTGELVYVLDPVAECIFFWNEEAYVESKPNASKPVAKVRCNARGVAMPAAPPWDDLSDDEKAQVAKAGPGKLRFVNEKLGEEKEGTHEAGGVKTVKYGHYAVRVDGGVKKKEKLNEFWYAPELDSIVEATRVPKRQPAKKAGGANKGAGDEEKAEDLRLFWMDSIWMGEPLEDFYPPHGYAIEVDETLLPPFAPVPKHGAKK